MTRSATPAESVGKQMAAVLSALEARHGAQSAQVRMRLFEDTKRRTLTHSQYRWAGTLAVGLVVTALALGLLRWRHLTEAPKFYVDGRPSEVRGFVAAPSEHVSHLSFRDGSRMELAPEGAIRVLEVGDHGATVNLEHGRVQADIVPRPGNDWQMTAGPFTVHVIGTRFAVDWDVSKGQLTVAVDRGRVAVWGSFISRREVDAGHRLIADVRASSVVESGAPTKTAPVEKSSEAVAITELPMVAEASARPAEISISSRPSGSLAPNTIKPTWHQLSNAGHFREAFAEAESSGFDSICAASSASDLLVLGDVARLAGQPGRARQAFLAVRARFPQDSRRVAAAFSLGKVAFDQLGDSAQAVDWFRICLREQPDGTLAREAHGRLMESLKRLGNLEAARQAATEYLNKYPSGPHAAVARSILGG